MVVVEANVGRHHALYKIITCVCVFYSRFFFHLVKQKKSWDFEKKKKIFFVFSCIFKSVEIKDLKTFYTYFGDIFLKNW